MSGRAGLRKVQIGLEATPGTAVPATEIWRGECGGMDDQREVVFNEECVGYVGGVGRTHTPKLLAGISLPATEASFEQVNVPLAFGIEDVSDGVADGVGSGYIYQYDAPSTTVNTVKAATVETGDDEQAEEAEYCTVERFSLTGRGGEAVKAASDWFGRQVATCSFTGALTPVTVEDILLSKGKLYIDAGGGTIGSTQQSDTLLGINLGWVTGWKPSFTADGQVYFTKPEFDAEAEEIIFRLTFKHNANAVAEKAAWRAETWRLVRLLIEGTALGTPGTDYTYKTLRVDLAGKWRKFDILGEEDGNSIVEGELVARYSVTDSLKGQIVVVNERSAMLA